MKITPVQHSNNAFNGGLNQAQKAFVDKIIPRKTAQTLHDNYDIMCAFGHNKIVAALADKTSKIADKLNMTHPNRISVYDFGIFKRSIVGTATWYSQYGFSLGVNIELNKKFFNCSIDKFNEFADKLEKKCGTSHVLCVFVHEFLHAHHQNKMDGETLKALIKIKMPKFEKEIKEKIAPYAKKNPIELYATYWAKEICNSLDENWLPKYNPFEKPQVSLSPELREFINAVGDTDVELAKKIAQNEKKFNWFLKRNKS